MKKVFISLGKHSNCFLALKKVYTAVSFDAQALLTKPARAGVGTVREPPPPDLTLLLFALAAQEGIEGLVDAQSA